MSNEDDQLVEDYLRELRNAARVLPADRLDELVEEITAHIAEARQSDGSPTAVRNILDRLGDPADIVRTAADAAPGSPGWSPGAGAGGWAAASAGPGDPAGRIGALEIAAVLLLLLGGLIIPVLGWFAGVVLLWISPRWTTRDKLLGTLVWPGGLLAAVLVVIAGLGGALVATSSQVCVSQSAVAPTASGQSTGHAAAVHCTTSGFSLPPWLSITLMVVLMTAAIGGPIWTAMRLLRRARQSPATSTPAPANLIPA